MDINTVRGLMTLAFLVAFLAIVFYAWRGRNKARFDAHAQAIIDDREG
ncbi:MAG: cbb3-type cytochrome oxidase subunit 3 [Lautropia sp.]